MIMFEGKTTPKEIFDLILKEIVRLGGLEKAFPHDGRIQLYTGPNSKYLEETPTKPRPTIGARIRNSKRADGQSKEWDAIRLDDTPIGDFLFVTNRLYDWFKEVHTDTTTGVFNEDQFKADTKEITAFASALFIRTASGDVQTCVCGGERDRVFCETEMHGMCDRSLFPVEAATLVAELLANKDIESINGVSIDKYRKIYASGNYERVYRAICLAELRQRLHKARKEKDADIYADYLDRKELYQYDQIFMGTPVAKSPAHQKVLRDKSIREAEKEALISKFKASYATPAAPKTPAPRGRKPAAHTLH